MDEPPKYLVIHEIDKSSGFDGKKAEAANATPWTVTLFYILENLAVNRILKKYRRKSVYGSLKRQSKVFRTARARSPARSH